MKIAAAALATVTAATTTCDTAVVGGGWAGIYSAWRLTIDTATIKPEDLCVFEAREAVGGRTYSVSIDDNMTLDIGAYRFGKSMHLPSDLIINKFKLPVQCYEPSCSINPELNQTLYRIVDAEGRSAGYATPIRMMLKELVAAKVRVFYEHQLTGIYDADPTTAAADEDEPSSALHFAGGEVATARAVLLNLPRNAIRRLDPRSVLFGDDPTAPPTQILRNCAPCGGGEGSLAVKVYAIYDDPWWLTKLNLSEGKFTSLDAMPPLVGRYHDGPVVRNAEGEPVGPGALEAVYTFTFLHKEIEWYVVPTAHAVPVQLPTASVHSSPHCLPCARCMMQVRAVCEDARGRAAHAHERPVAAEAGARAADGLPPHRVCQAWAQRVYGRADDAADCSRAVDVRSVLDAHQPRVVQLALDDQVVRL